MLFYVQGLTPQDLFKSSAANTPNLGASLDEF
jgi:hypothetical protein